MSKEYSYPLELDWTTQEMIAVVEFYQMIEAVYEKGVDREQFMVKYRAFKEVVRSIAGEKTAFREFEEVSGYAAFPAVKAAKEGASIIRIQQKK